MTKTSSGREPLSSVGTVGWWGGLRLCLLRQGKASGRETWIGGADAGDDPSPEGHPTMTKMPMPRARRGRPRRSRERGAERIEPEGSDARAEGARSKGRLGETASPVEGRIGEPSRPRRSRCRASKAARSNITRIEARAVPRGSVTRQMLSFASREAAPRKGRSRGGTRIGSPMRVNERTEQEGASGQSETKKPFTRLGRVGLGPRVRPEIALRSRADAGGHVSFGKTRLRRESPRVTKHQRYADEIGRRGRQHLGAIRRLAEVGIAA